MLDLTLAIAHHPLIFGIFGIICAELWAVRPGLSAGTVQRVASMDLWYGVLAAAIIVIGFCRAIFAAKGWAYYAHNAFFWAKSSTFDLKTVRRYLHRELSLFVFLPIFAAAMARGHG